MSGFNPKWIKGKVVARVEMNTESLHAGRKGVKHNPEIHFTDGSRICFNVVEDEDNYGIDIRYYKQ
jgi:hypothetical protein